LLIITRPHFVTTPQNELFLSDATLHRQPVI
jgi:hypothetical protein